MGRGEPLPRIYVWSPFVRVTHLLIALSIFGALFSGFFKPLFSLHLFFGSLVFVLLIARILYGFFGTTYERFSHFDFSWRDLRYYFLHLFRDKRSYIGHNPAASWVMIFIILGGVAVTLTGLLLLGAMYERGPLDFLGKILYFWGDFLKKAHQLIALAILIASLIHIIGTLIEHFYHRTRIIDSMVHGYKPYEGKDLHPSILQSLFGIGAILLSLTIAFYAANDRSYREFLALHDLYPVEFRRECSSCHTLYPPQWLPSSSWKIIMQDLKGHFGKDAKEYVKHPEIIQTYLLAHSSEHHPSYFPHAITRSNLQSQKYRLSRISFIRELHAKIPPKLFEHPAIKTRSNCQACHLHFDEGILQPEEIRIPDISFREALQIYLR
ncbi:hypothetical protein WS0705 [Wolinella succinogenes]|uniref:Cytochrome b561 bacterial/Ni-hydrogenase domain-containing protein n=1 Tax=Wolinella succinogenes (strain ATCC 29543 / DSM 1740 / CCUG 13145 / JCM 31913 / LMG 7466 / NCTC 11488 / FDC 602W) TaxID=273121 RepID=Q7MS71_WOLSU|nr:hypothetical protein WS0705 [Wolinella succinogenes]HCZ19447.1 hypothetical protein [Helicobacter sp.]